MGSTETPDRKLRQIREENEEEKKGQLEDGEVQSRGTLLRINKKGEMGVAIGLDGNRLKVRTKNGRERLVNSSTVKRNNPPMDIYGEKGERLAEGRLFWPGGEAFDFLYVLINPLLPGFFKIGRTDDVARRLAQLSAETSCLAPFAVLFCFKITLPQSGVHPETWLHRRLNRYRLQPQKEFFNCPIQVLMRAMSSLEIEYRGTIAKAHQTFA